MKVSLILTIFLLYSSLIFSPFQGDSVITIFLVGDSTLADKPFAGSNPEKGWGQVFPLYFKEGIMVENHAMNGRSTKSFREEGRWELLQNKIKPEDYGLIQFGINDHKKESPERYADADTDYRYNLIHYVEEIVKKGGQPILATPITRRL